MIVLFISFAGCKSQREAKKTVAKANVSSDLIYSQPHLLDAEGIVGRRLAIQHCQRCHMFVEPEALPKAVWQSFVFPRMGAFMGMHHVEVETLIDNGIHPAENQIIKSAGIYAKRSAMTKKEWKTLVAYYMSNAPEKLEKPVNIESIELSTELFREEEFGYKQDNPATTLIRIDEGGRRLFVGDRAVGNLSILELDLRLSQKIKLGSAPVHLQIMEGDLWVTKIGTVIPRDLPAGELVVLNGDNLRNIVGKKKLERLRRPTHASYADINNDGLTDILMSEYGNQVGAFNYYQAKKDGGYKKVELMKEPGSMTSHIRDFNNDGWLDVAVILGQNKEGVHIHYNNGDGSFTWSYALPLPPHYGSSNFAFYDFNGDGYIDILATNGDNGDYPAILKPHHGVRIYLNDGKNAFKESYFFHMNGAFKALAEDFDLDGDLDIAAISMFPDLNDRPEEGFVYLENDGKLNFKASSISRVKEGRWLCMDTGDLDGDGDQDIVIGSFIRGPSEVPPSFLKAWENGALPGLVLWNKTK